MSTKLYESLKHFKEIIQLKDSFFKSNYTYEYTLAVKGVVLIKEIIRVIKGDNNKGLISLEGEKPRYLELPLPKVALTQYVENIQKLF